MVNNLMSGLLGQPTATSASLSSSASSTGTSTTTTASPTGSFLPGVAPSGQPGMPRASIRIQNPAGLSGFFPGRMPQIPG